MPSIRCTVVSSERPLFEGDVERVVAQGAKGQIAVFPRHAPLIAKLDPGVLRIVRADADGGEERFAVSGGFLQVRNNVVMILVADATRREDLDRTKLDADIAENLEALRHPRNDEEYRDLLRKRAALAAQSAVLGKR